MIAICTLSIAKISDCKHEWCLLLLMFSVYPRKAQKVFIIAILVKSSEKHLLSFGLVKLMFKVRIKIKKIVAEPSVYQ